MIENLFTKVTVEGVDYYDSKHPYPHQEALDLAAKHGLRVLERWELCKLFDESEAFRASLEAKRYWSASVYSYSHYGAWKFVGYNGGVSVSIRYLSSYVRCVGMEGK